MGRVVVQDNRLELGISFELRLGYYACYRDIKKGLVYLVPDIRGDIPTTRKRQGYRDERWAIQSAKLIRTLVSTLKVNPKDYVFVKVGETGVIYFSATPF